MTTCFFFRNRPLGKSPHQSCRTLRGEVDSGIPRVSRGLRVVVFEALENAELLETSPDKKMGVGSLRKPRECDGRLPPDAGYYLDLVLPRSEESPKKITSRVRLFHGRILQTEWSITSKFTRILVNLLINSRILVNLLVKLTRILVISVNLLVNLTRKNPLVKGGGGHGAWGSRGWPLSCWWGQYGSGGDSMGLMRLWRP